MTYYSQHDETDCGAACLAMIASFYNLQKSITSIRMLCGTDKQGTAGVVIAAAATGAAAGSTIGGAFEA